VVKKNKIKFPILLDRGGELEKLYKIKAIPRIYIIDRNGSVAADFTGYSKSLKVRIEETMKRLLEPVEEETKEQ
jgi:hypothetical protein